MVGVSKSVCHDVPSLIPLEAFDINQNALKLDNCKGWVSVIKLDSHLVGELAPSSLGLLETPDNVMQGSSTPEVLLLQAELLASLEIIIRVEDSGDGLCTLLVRNGAFIITSIELLEVKLSAAGLARPKSKVVRRLGSIARDGHIIGNGLDNFAIFPGMHDLAALILVLANAAIKLNVDRNFVTREFPGIIIEPVVGDLHLVSVYDLLLEDSIAVSQSVSPSRVVQCSHAV